MVDLNIFLFGNGWGAVAAYKSLVAKFPNIVVATNDDNLKSLAGLNAKMISFEDINNSLIIFAGYAPIVPASVLAKNTCINIHYSLLPKYRGYHPTVWALLNDEEYIGGTVHLMSEYVDDGDIIYQWKVENDRQKTSTDYMLYFNKHIEDNLGDVIEGFISGDIKPVPQDKSKASWVAKRNLQDCKIDFSKPIDWQRRFWRCLVPPYPEPFVEWKGKHLVVRNVSFKESPEISHLGRIVNIDNDGLWVKCKDGYIVIHEFIDTQNNEIFSLKNFKIGMFLDENMKLLRLIDGYVCEGTKS